MVEISVYAKNTGEGLNPDKRIQEEKDIALIETNSAVLESDEFDQEKIKEFIAASNRLGLMEETDPSKISKQDERIHFHIDGKYYAYNQDTYPEGMSIEEAKSLVKLEEKFHALEVQNRKLKGIDPDVALTDTEKEHLKELKKEILQVQEHEKDEASYIKQGEEYDRFIQTADELKKEEEKREEVAKADRQKPLEDKIEMIGGAGNNQEVFRAASSLIEKENVNQPQRASLVEALEQLQVDVPELNVDEAKIRAIDLIIQKEVANRPEEVPMTFGAASDLLRKELSEEQIRQNLTNDELTNYYRDKFVNRRELFEATATDEQKAEKEELLREYAGKAKTRVVERLGEVSEEEWNPRIPYDKIREFILKEDKASAANIAPYLGREQFIALFESVYINPENRSHFDALGAPIDATGKEILKSFREEARGVAESNENRAIREKAEKEFDEGAFGKSVNASMDKCLKVMDEDDMPRSWGERMKLRFLRGEEGREILKRYDKASNEYERISRFKDNYLNRKGEYIATINEFERTIREQVGENLLEENLSQRTRRQIRKAAFKVRTRRMTLNEKLKKGLGNLEDCSYLEEAYKENKCASFADFVSDGLIREEGWTPPTVMGGKEADEKYGTSKDKEQDKFLEGKDFGALREVAFKYNRNEVIKELKADIRKDLERDIASGIVNLKGVGLNRTKREVDAMWESYWPLHAGEIEEKVNQRTEQHIKKLKDGFLDVNADGLMKFAVETGYRGQILRKELHDEIFGDKGERLLSATKIINLLEGQRINDLMLHERDRRFELELKRFCGKEGWRQRIEGLDRFISGNPTFKKDEYRGLRSALEEGLSYRSSVYQSSVKAKAYTYDMFGGISTAWNKTKRTGYQVLNFVAPNSEGIRQKIDDTNRNISRRYASKQFRWENILNFGMPADFPRARA